MLQPGPITDQAIRDTVAVLARHAQYDRSLRQTAIQRFLAWLSELFAPLGRAIDTSKPLQRVALVLVILFVVAVIARAMVVAHAARIARAAERGGGRGRGTAGRLADPWLEAQRLAANGDYTAAAHSAYAAVLLALSRRARIRLHPSKTVGDYARELRRTQSPLAPRYREFARLYEVVIYGVGTCDRDRWERLQVLAADLVERERQAA
jgi:Domain of unknown function (DUF4129)